MAENDFTVIRIVKTWKVIPEIYANETWKRVGQRLSFYACLTFSLFGWFYLRDI